VLVLGWGGGGRSLGVLAQPASARLEASNDTVTALMDIRFTPGSSKVNKY